MLAPILRTLAHGVVSGKAFSVGAPLLGPLAPRRTAGGTVCGTADLVPSVTGGRAGLGLLVIGAAGFGPEVAGVAALEEC